MDKKTQCCFLFQLVLTFPMLRLLSFKAQGCKGLWKPSKPCHVGIHWIFGQDLETGCPKLAFVKLLGVQSFQVGPQYTQISTINRYKHIETRHNILLQCHGNYTSKNSIIRLGLAFKEISHIFLLIVIFLLLLFWGLGVQKTPRLPTVEDYPGQYCIRAVTLNGWNIWSPLRLSWGPGGRDLQNAKSH